MVDKTLLRDLFKEKEGIGERIYAIINEMDINKTTIIRYMEKLKLLDQRVIMEFLKDELPEG